MADTGTSTSRTVLTNRVDLCVETFGHPEAPAIVLLHGAGNDMHSWDETFCARLAAGPRFVVRIDNRDCGRSTTYPVGAPPYEMRDVADDVVGVLDALGIERAHFVGMSGGAALAQLLGIEYADRVATLTLVSYTSQDAASAMSPGLPAPPPAPDWADDEAVVDYIVEVHRPYSAAFDEQRTRALARRVVDRALDIEASQTNPYLVALGEPWHDRLGEIRAPTLVAHGTEDPLFPFDGGRAMADAIPGAAFLALEHTGHEYFPPHTWDVVIPALLEHTA
jgi:pimeloyl-ACP methyl ester carboxylesterase